MLLWFRKEKPCLTSTRRWPTTWVLVLPAPMVAGGRHSCPCWLASRRFWRMLLLPLKWQVATLIFHSPGPLASPVFVNHYWRLGEIRVLAGEERLKSAHLIFPTALPESTDRSTPNAVSPPGASSLLKWISPSEAVPVSSKILSAGLERSVMATSEHRAGHAAEHTFSQRVKGQRDADAQELPECA